MDVDMKEHFIVCECSSQDHTICVRYCDDMDGDQICWIEVQLHQYRSFFQRIVIAIKYIFGYQCRYGHWDSTSINISSGEKLVDFLNKAIKDKKSKV